MKNSNFNIILVIIILVIIIVFAILLHSIIHQNESINDRYYGLEIKTNKTGKYSLLVPYLYNVELEREIKIKAGNGTIDFVNISKTPTNHTDRGIQVMGEGNMKIYGYVENNARCYMTLINSQQIGKKIPFWIWGNKTNLNQNISISITAGYSSGTADYIYYNENRLGGSNYEPIENGWNLIYLRYDMSIP